MKFNLFTLALTIFTFTAFSCTPRYYSTAAYDDYAQQHQLIAVLPSQTITTGRIPADWTEEDRKLFEENESYAFQVAVFDEIAQRSGRAGNEVDINLQHYTETNAKLADAGITMRDSWDMPPTELATLLGVDAVVRTSIRKNMYLTDLESFGVTAAQVLLGGVTALPWLIPNRTSDVFLSASVLDGRTGVVVWNTDMQVETDFNNPHAEIVRRLARVLARRFPYRV